MIVLSPDNFPVAVLFGSNADALRLNPLKPQKLPVPMLQYHRA